MRYLKKGSVQGLAAGGWWLPGAINLFCLLATLFPSVIALGTVRYGTAVCGLFPPPPSHKTVCFPSPRCSSYNISWLNQALRGEAWEPNITPAQPQPETSLKFHGSGASCAMACRDSVRS